MEIEGRHVVVTGAGRGIGRALALRVADEGARAVVVSDMDEATAQAVAEEVGGLAVTADVGREEDIRASCASEEANGPITCLLQRRITGRRRPGMLDESGTAVARQHDGPTCGRGAVRRGCQRVRLHRVPPPRPRGCSPSRRDG